MNPTKALLISAMAMLSLVAVTRAEEPQEREQPVIRTDKIGSDGKAVIDMPVDDKKKEESTHDHGQCQGGCTHDHGHEHDKHDHSDDMGFGSGSDFNMEELLKLLESLKGKDFGADNEHMKTGGDKPVTDTDGKTSGTGLSDSDAFHSDEL